MPTIPDRRALGQIRVNGKATPEQINPAVAYDIGRAGAAYNAAMHQIAAAFSGLGEKQQAMDDAAWLSQAKIDTLTADDAIRRETELNAGPDGTGFEQAPMKLNEAIGAVEQKPGGSPEARTKFKLWSAEQAFSTGRWAASTAQGRLKESTGTGLDKRLDELQTLSSANPDRALEYSRVYEEEVRSKVGFAITSQEAENRIQDGKTRIIKESVITRAKTNPADFGRAVKALEENGAAPPPLFSDVNPETRGLTRRAAQHPSSVSYKLETGHDDPMKGLKNVSKDAGGTKSYGNFGINSGGSAQQFKAKYGEQFGLTAEPGTAAFDKQWRNAAGAAPVELHEAELEWWDATIGSKLTNNLTKVGVSADMARDPRVLAYFADRSVQQGPASIAKHAGRVQEAFKKADGSVEKFLSNMSSADKSKMSQDFPTALESGVYGARGHANRINGRERRSLAVAGGGVPAPEAPKTDTSKLPMINGTIQPHELLALSPKDYDAVTRELRPHMAADMENRMNKAVSSLIATGRQDIVKPEELDDMRTILPPKTLDEWKKSLVAAEETHVAAEAIKRMTPQMRRAQLSALVPTGRVQDLTEGEMMRFEVWSKTTKHIEDQIRKDPLGYFSIEHESGRQAMKQIATAPAGEEGTPMRERALDTLMQLQRNEGIPLSDIRVMGDDQAGKIANAFREAKTGPAAGIIADDIRKTYGKHADRVWAELAKNGAPIVYQTLRTATRQGQDAMVKSFALENSMIEAGSKEGRKGLLVERSGLKKSEISEAVSNEINPYLISMGNKQNSAQLVQSYRDAAERLTAYYAITEGKGAKEAAKQATASLIASKVTLVEGVPIPAEIAEQNSGPITRALRNMDVEIDADAQMIVPPIRSDKRFPADNAHTQYISRLKNNHKFVPTEDGNGVYMLDENEEYVMIDTENGLAPWTRTLDELIKQPRASRWYLGPPVFTNPFGK